MARSSRKTIPTAFVPLPCAAPMIHTGPCLVSFARSAAVTITAHAPSLSMQQSSRCSGSAIIREAWWSSSVIGLRIIARGFIDPCLRNATAT